MKEGPDAVYTVHYTGWHLVGHAAFFNVPIFVSALILALFVAWKGSRIAPPAILVLTIVLFGVYGWPYVDTYIHFGRQDFWFESLSTTLVTAFLIWSLCAGIAWLFGAYIYRLRSKAKVVASTF